MAKAYLTCICGKCTEEKEIDFDLDELRAVMGMSNQDMDKLEGEDMAEDIFNI